MTVVDTSAIVAVLLEEPGSEAIERELLQGPCVMSAATRVELGIVVEARAGAAGTQLLEELLARIDIQIAPVDEDQARDALVSGAGSAREGTKLPSTSAIRSPMHSHDRRANRSYTSATTSAELTSPRHSLAEPTELLQACSAAAIVGIAAMYLGAA